MISLKMDLVEGFIRDITTIMIYNIINLIYCFCSIETSDFNRNFFEITQQQYEETKMVYESQCAKIYNSGMEHDAAFITLLAVGRKNHFNYVQHLVDDFFCDKIKNIGTVWNVRKRI
eukprot:245851_1